MGPRMDCPVTHASNPVLRALLAMAGVVTLALCWFGWRLFTQERAVARERQRDRLERSLEAMAAGVRGKWAEAGESLSRWVSGGSERPPDIAGAVVFTVAGERVAVSPQGGLVFVPLPAAPPGGQPPAAEAFAKAEAVEFGPDGAARAAGIYRELAARAEPRLRAEALLRLGRVLLKSGDGAGARQAYAALAHLAGIAVAGLPAELVGLDGQRKAGAAGIEQRMAAGLQSGKWLLARGPAEHYREVAGLPANAEDLLLAEAMADLWERRGGPVLEVRGRLWLGLWRGNRQRWAGLVAGPARLLEIKAPAGIQFQLTDARGRPMAGAAGRARPGVSQVLGEPESPWVLRVWQDGEVLDEGTSIPLLVGLVILLLWGAVYFMARAIRREAEVARLQSDFVAAVSHEFRSPLTTVRQLSEMLEMGQVPNEERRRKYYSVLAGEAQRLQRLVEGLLRFGRMEAGAQSYRREPLEIGSVVRRAVEEVESGGGRVDVEDGGAIHLNGDPEALAAAVRNLLENALKYSPADSRVEARWGRDGAAAVISVRDHGPGIPADEQKTVFEKFVRGRRAVEASIKGTGVGLAMVKHIMAAHEGEVRLESRPGEGCTFTLRLPEGD